MAKDCLVKFTKDTLVRPVKVKSVDDITVETRPDGSVKNRAKTESSPVWVVEVKMPRRYVDEFSSERVQIDNDNYVDLDSLDAEAEVEQEEDMMQDQDLAMMQTQSTI